MKKHNTNFLNYFSFLIKVLFFISISLVAISEENQIGLVSEINGDAIAINDNLDERDLSIFDPIFSNEEIFATQNSSLVLQFNDNTSIIMKELTSLNVSEFENSKLNPQFRLKILKGNVIIESGLIAKNKNGEMEVLVKTSTLGLRGTRVNADLNKKDELNISLGEDNFGNTGIIEITNNGKKEKITAQDQIYEISKNKISSREKSTEEQNNEKLANEIFVNSSTIDEDKIEIQLISKLVNGKIDDLNNDGLIDISDVEELKNQILNNKKQKIEFVIDNTKKENTEFLSSVINKSDEKNTGEVLEKIINTKDDLVEDVVEDLSDKNNEFLITSNLKSAGFIKEKIFETIVGKETDKSALILSKVMAKADISTLSSVINNITDKNSNQDSKLSLKVMADFSENNPIKLETLAQNNEDQIIKLTVSAVEEAASSENDAELIASIVAVASDKVINNVITEVNKNSTEEKESLAAKVMSSIIDKDPQKIDSLSVKNKEKIIDKTIQAAKKQSDNKTDNSSDLTAILSKIVVNSSDNTASEIMENLNNKNEDQSKFGLIFFIKLSEEENFESKLKKISDKSIISGDVVEKMIQNAIKSIEGDSDIELVKDAIDKSEGFIIDKIIDIGNKGNNTNEIKVIKILDEIIKEDPIKIVKIIEDNKEKEIIKKIIKTKKPKVIKKIKEIYPIDVSPN
jgi:hypothetical protein